MEIERALFGIAKMLVHRRRILLIHIKKVIERVNQLVGDHIGNELI